MFDQYCQSLEAGLPEKAALMFPWIARESAGNIVDIGCGAGGLASRLAALRPAAKVIGVDHSLAMIRSARRRFASPTSNLAFRQGSALSVHAQNASAVILSSVLHEVYSEHGYALRAVARALECVRQTLGPDGRLIIRDFLRPVHAERPVWLKHTIGDIVPGYCFRSFAPREIHNQRSTRDYVAYQASLGLALEYALKKDFQALWHSELRECYGFWDLRTARRLLVTAGFTVIHCRPLRSPWLAQHRLRRKIALTDLDGRPLCLPAEKVLIVAKPSDRSLQKI